MNDRSSEPTQPSAAESRGARRKRRTRNRLLRAALKLMGARGMEGVAINEITEAADVGFGSFYNHFESKEAIYQALIDELFVAFGEALDRIADEVDDPAEVLAASIRYGLQRARQDPDWGHFLVQVGFSPSMLKQGLAHRLMRDIQRGLSSGRFRTHDPVLAFISLGTTVLGAISFMLDFEPSNIPEGVIPPALIPSADSMEERLIVQALSILGLELDDARTVARRPLPAIEFPEDSL